MDERAQSGKFATRDEAVNDALQKQMQREEELAWLKREMEIGIEQAGRGEYIEFDCGED